ncbi:NIPA-like protein 3 [Nowakowskiella sp. JEL0078]|nr:NIPA-like protein 3 [Nowakowskiella sp. JEL0078]
MHSTLALSAVFLLVKVVLAAGNGQKCSSDDDCLVFNKQLPSWQSGVTQNYGYLCVSGECTSIAASGRICELSSECAVYQFVKRQLANNISASTFLPQSLASNVTNYLESICSPSYCTISSTCDSSQDILTRGELQLYLPHNPSNYSCCGAAQRDWQCSQLGGFLSTCGDGNECYPYDGNQVSSDSGLPSKKANYQYCTDSTAKSKSGQWVGIVMVILGATLLNVGLNVQKLALRKRHEQRRESDRMQILVALQAIREKIIAQRAEAAAVGSRARTSSRKSFMGLWGEKIINNSSNVELSSLINSEGDAATVVGTESLERRLPEGAGPSSRIHSWLSTFGSKSTHHSESKITVTDTVSITPSINHTPVSNPPPVPPINAAIAQAGRNGLKLDIPSISTPTSESHTRSPWRIQNIPSPQSPNRRVDSDLQSLEIPEAPADAIQFEKSLGLGRLLVNPIWLFGLLLFTLGNFLNFIALQFAAQSLVAPLGAWALVVNVITAPLINHESWGWKDVVGIVFIVGGSAMVVIFAGVSGKDYNLCVLMALFGRLATIIFLAVTGALLIFIFFLLCTIEKNIDLGEDDEVSDAEEEQEQAITPDHTFELEDRRFSRRYSEDRKSSKTQFAAREIIRQALESHQSQVLQNQNTNQIYHSHRSVPVESPIAMAEATHTFRHKRRNSEPHLFAVENNSIQIDLDRGNTPTHDYLIDEIDVMDSASQKRISSDTPENFVFSEPIDIPQTSSANQLNKHTVSSSIHKQSSTTGLTRIPEGSFSEYFTTPENQAATPSSRPASRPMRMRSVAAALRSEHNLPLREQKTKSKLFWLWFWKRLPKSFKKFIKESLTWYHNKGYVPTLKNKISLTSPSVLYILPLSYATLGGLMATITVLFAKSTIHLITETLFQNNNQFNNFFAWLISLVTVVTAVLQIYWINMGLQRYDALLQIPVFYVVWTVFDVIGGGVAVIFVGVGILAMRLKSIHDSDVMETAALNQGPLPLDVTSSPVTSPVVTRPEITRRQPRRDRG